MPPAPERVVRVAAAEKGGETYEIEHETDRLPDDPEKIAEFLHRNLLEINTHNISGKGELSEEAQFVARLEAVMAEFYRERAPELPPERRPSLSFLVSILEGSFETTMLPPAEMRALMDRIYDRFSVPERSDLTILEGDTPVSGQAGRIGAHRRLLKGITSAWAKLLEASWRQYYAETFPARIKGELEDVALLETAPGEQRALMQSLVVRFEKTSPYRFRRLLKALIDLSSEEGPKSGAARGVITAPELKALAAYVTSRLPEGRAMTAEELFEQMRAGALEQGGETRMPKETLGLLIEGFAHDIHAVHELADIDFLFNNEDSRNPNFILNTIRERWGQFSPAQQAQYIDLVRANFAAVPPKGNEGAKPRPGKKVQARVELDRLCKDLGKDLLKPGAKIKDEKIKDLALLVKFRVYEIADYRTKPEGDQERQEREAANAETQSPAERLTDIMDALSHPRAYVLPLARILVREDMAGARQALFKDFIEIFGSAGNKNMFVTRIQDRMHREVSEQEVGALQSVIDESGDSTNRLGWEVLLQVGNGFSSFRTLMSRKVAESRPLNAEGE